MKHSTVVPKIVANANCQPVDSSVGCDNIAFRQNRATSKVQNLKTNGLSYIREFYLSKGFSSEATNIICSSWRDSTCKQYEVYIRKWNLFCNKQKIDPLQFDEIRVAQFLTEMFNRGASYSAINSARSALSTFLVNGNWIPIGSVTSLKRLLKGIFEMKPPMPRYNYIWDVNIVLDYLRLMSPCSDIPLSHLTYKLLMLVALASSQRVQTIREIKVNN